MTYGSLGAEGLVGSHGQHQEPRLNLIRHLCISCCRMDGVITVDTNWQ
jgi:hypothetical protein